jgi:predicted N-acetyltransferase YhbS
MAYTPAKTSASVEIEYLADHRDAMPIIAGWIFDEWSFLYPDQTIESVEGFLRERLHKRVLPLTLVAFKDKKPVGTVSLKKFEIETRRDMTPWIASLYVQKQCRGKGIGTRLMKAIEEKAARLDIKKLYLFTANPGLVDRFYSNLGWKTEKKTRYHSYMVTIMKKDIGGYP